MCNGTGSATSRVLSEQEKPAGPSAPAPSLSSTTGLVLPPVVAFFPLLSEHLAVEQLEQQEAPLLSSDGDVAVMMTRLHRFVRGPAHDTPALLWVVTHSRQTFYQNHQIFMRLQGFSRSTSAKVT